MLTIEQINQIANIIDSHNVKVAKLFETSDKKLELYFDIINRSLIKDVVEVTGPIIKVSFHDVYKAPLLAKPLEIGCKNELLNHDDEQSITRFKRLIMSTNGYRDDLKIKLKAACLQSLLEDLDESVHAAKLLKVSYIILNTEEEDFDALLSKMTSVNNSVINRFINNSLESFSNFFKSETNPVKIFFCKRFLEKLVLLSKLAIPEEESYADGEYTFFKIVNGWSAPFNEFFLKQFLDSYSHHELLYDALKETHPHWRDNVIHKVSFRHSELLGTIVHSLKSLKLQEITNLLFAKNHQGNFALLENFKVFFENFESLPIKLRYEILNYSLGPSWKYGNYSLIEIIANSVSGNSFYQKIFKTLLTHPANKDENGFLIIDLEHAKHSDTEEKSILAFIRREDEQETKFLSMLRNHGAIEYENEIEEFQARQSRQKEDASIAVDKQNTHNSAMRSLISHCVTNLKATYFKDLNKEQIEEFITLRLNELELYLEDPQLLVDLYKHVDRTPPEVKVGSLTMEEHLNIFLKRVAISFSRIKESDSSKRIKLVELYFKKFDELLPSSSPSASYDNRALPESGTQSIEPSPISEEEHSTLPQDRSVFGDVLSDGTTLREAFALVIEAITQLKEHNKAEIDTEKVFATKELDYENLTESQTKILNELGSEAFLNLLEALDDNAKVNSEGNISIVDPYEQGFCDVGLFGRIIMLPLRGRHIAFKEDLQLQINEKGLITDNSFIEREGGIQKIFYEAIKLMVDPKQVLHIYTNWAEQSFNPYKRRDESEFIPEHQFIKGKMKHVLEQKAKLTNETMILSCPTSSSPEPSSPVAIQDCHAVVYNKVDEWDFKNMPLMPPFVRVDELTQERCKDTPAINKVAPLLYFLMWSKLKTLWMLEDLQNKCTEEGESVFQKLDKEKLSWKDFDHDSFFPEGKGLDLLKAYFEISIKMYDCSYFQAVKYHFTGFNSLLIKNFGTIEAVPSYSLCKTLLTYNLYNSFKETLEFTLEYAKITKMDIPEICKGILYYTPPTRIEGSDATRALHVFAATKADLRPLKLILQAEEEFRTLILSYKDQFQRNIAHLLSKYGDEDSFLIEFIKSLPQELMLEKSKEGISVLHEAAGNSHNLLFETVFDLLGDQAINFLFEEDKIGITPLGIMTETFDINFIHRFYQEKISPKLTDHPSQLLKFSSILHSYFPEAELCNASEETAMWYSTLGEEGLTAADFTAH